MDRIADMGRARGAATYARLTATLLAGAALLAGAPVLTPVGQAPAFAQAKHGAGTSQGALYRNKLIKGQTRSVGGQQVAPDKFGRLFTLGETYTDANGQRFTMAPLQADVAALRRLGAIDGPMHEKSDAESRDSNIPAGFVFFGQFIDHDITFDTVSSLDEPISDQDTENARTPTLDLDSIYGGGPERTPYLYRMPYLAKGKAVEQGRHDLLRRTSVSGDTTAPGDGAASSKPARPAAQPAARQPSNATDLLNDAINDALGGGGTSSSPRATAPQRPPTPRVPARYRHMNITMDVALIGDPRNDENAVISQMQAAFIDFHNANVDRLARVRGIDLLALERDVALATDPEDRLVKVAAERRAHAELFEAARDHTIHYYHRIIVEDYLPRIIGHDRVQNIMINGRRWYFADGFNTAGGRMAQPFIPVEFSVAAFRYGHSQVRGLFDLSAATTRVPLFNAGAGTVDMRGFKQLNRGRMIDWHYFFPMANETIGRVQSARPLDTRLPTSLFRLDLADVTPAGEVPSLASRNLNRGQIFSLPSGQAIARAMGLSDAFILQADRATRSILGTQETPLWYYVLQEAKQQGIAPVAAVAGRSGASASASGGAAGRYFIPRSAGLAPTRLVAARSTASAAQTDSIRKAVGSAGGDILGPVGGTIVGEVLLGLLEHYRLSTGHGLDLRSEIDRQMSFRTVPGIGRTYQMGSMLQDATQGAPLR
ncbi:MAG: peroxidase family protein [Pseudomonadota bacterium]